MTKLRAFAAFLLLVAPAVAFAASGREPPPPGAFAGAPPQYTHFTARELSRGFFALAFGSDFLVGQKPKGIRRYDHPISVHIVSASKIDRTAAMTRIVEDYARAVPNLRVNIVPDKAKADVDVHLIDARDFKAALETAFGSKVTRRFMARSDPICMTGVESDAGGAITRSASFVIADRGDKVFLDCAYHELLHAFGLPNHDQRNPWTTLNQHRMVGYLTAYDRALLTMLYDRRMRPGMTRRQVQLLLPRLIADFRHATAKTSR